jgi:hypothetical protein
MTEPPTTTSTSPSARTHTKKSHRARRPKLAKLMLTARGGDCWVQVRARGASGELLYEGTLLQGETQRFTKWKKLWLQLGAPGYLKAKLNGHSAGLPTSPAIVVVTAKGVHTVSTA